MDKMREAAKKRENIYGFISGIFKEELKTGQIKEMIDTGVLSLVADIGYDIDLNFFINKPLQQIEEELAVEYTSLFVGPGKHIPPYESIHVSSDSTDRYWGECTVDMKNWVEHYGLQISGRFESIPDHISIELVFMQKVIEHERLAWEKDDTDTAEKCVEVEKAFFNKHIIKWVPGFCEKIIEAARLDLYREIARLTSDFIMDEKDLLQISR
ncbi:MAG: molecular chaperone [Nitrospinota bacterium]